MDYPLLIEGHPPFLVNGASSAAPGVQPVGFVVLLSSYSPVVPVPPGVALLLVVAVPPRHVAAALPAVAGQLPAVARSGCVGAAAGQVSVGPPGQSVRKDSGR